MERFHWLNPDGTFSLVEPGWNVFIGLTQMERFHWLNPDGTFSLVEPGWNVFIG